MRKMLIGLTVVVLLWSGWWALGAFAIERGVAGWLDARRADGWQAEVTLVETSGFPFRWEARMEDISLREPTTSAQIFAETLTVQAATYWPFAATLHLPAQPILYETAGNTFSLVPTDGQATIQFNPSLPPTLSDMALLSDAWQLNNRQGNILSAQSFAATVTQTSAPDTYDISLASNTFTPGDVIRQQLGLPADWPRAFELFMIQLTARVDPAAPPQPPEAQVAVLRQLDIQEVAFAWGQTSLTATGSASIDSTGLPDGSFMLLIKNWREPYEITKQTGALKPELHLQSDLMLNALANMGGDPETLDLTISFRDGAMFLGPISLGPAPRILF